MIGKPEILNVLSCARVFIAVENWTARCSRTIVGLFRRRTRAFGAKTNCQEVSAGAVFFFLIFLSNMNGQMQRKLDK